MSQIDEKTSVKTFPLQMVSDALLAELTVLAEGEAQIQGLSLPSQPAALRTMHIRLDSLTVVAITCALDDILGFEPKDIVRAGGYESIDAAMNHMMPRIEAAWIKRHPVRA
ncbi:hypothetical protein SH203_00137 [Brevundimonas sp. SH203]|uniref:hypothetical protein n=1 Tax=Brevundimonas sp. SH203 TaxID=345167 RepID=UPI0009C51A8A|nr:hypothetical protein [Brevundimonas sp. SH203]GAW39759.1 hypothetical protein SH203_00137 [Brevundimonas sp. SH203]